jgi:hypothetical protein
MSCQPSVDALVVVEMVAGCLGGSRSECQRVVADRTHRLLQILAVMVQWGLRDKMRKCDFLVGESV